MVFTRRSLILPYIQIKKNNNYACHTSYPGMDLNRALAAYFTFQKNMHSISLEKVSQKIYAPLDVTHSRVYQFFKTE